MYFENKNIFMAKNTVMLVFVVINIKSSTKKVFCVFDIQRAKNPKKIEKKFMFFLSA
jgi:hypothetical protein